MNLIKKILKHKFFLLILFLGIFLRVVFISKIPPSLNWDEVSHGYNAYSILKTGKDEWGINFPIIFRAYGDYKLPVYIYLTSLSIAAFNLNTFAIRLPSVLAGIGTIIFTYLLTKELFKKDWIAILSSLLVSLEPWSLFLSRAAFEANLSIFLIVSGVYFFVKAINKKSKTLILSSLMFGLSVWTYNSARILVPLLISSFIIIYLKELKDVFKTRKNTIYYSAFILLIFLLPMFYQLVNPVGQARYGWVEILDKGAIAKIEQARNTSNLPHTINIMLNNRPIYFLKEFVKNYFSHFSFKFLFLEGGSHYQFSIPKTPLLYPVNAIFLAIGLLSLVKRRKKGDLTLLSWFLLAPIASGLTREAPHVLRSSVILPVPMIIASVGLISSANYIVKRKLGKILKIILLLAYGFLVLWGTTRYFGRYIYSYPKEYSWAWQYGYEQAVDYVKENYEKYEKIIVTKKYGEPHEFFLFYWPWDPERYRNDNNLVRFFQSDWYWVDRFDKFYFVNDWQIDEEETDNFVFNLESKKQVNCRNQKCLLITSPGNVPSDWVKLETIYFLNGEEVFEIYEN